MNLAKSVVVSIVVSMARKPNPTSPVAVIRSALGMTAGEFAKFLSVGKSTIQHIETGDRPLKAELADKIYLSTGVPRDWLDRDTLSKSEVETWLGLRSPSERASLEAQGRPVFDPKNFTELKLAGGPNKVRATAYRGEFPSAIDRKIEALYYLCGCKGINPNLVLLAMDRACSEAAKRFGIEDEDILQLQAEIDRYRFGSALRVERPSDHKDNPGFVAMQRAVERRARGRRQIP